MTVTVTPANAPGDNSIAMTYWSDIDGTVYQRVIEDLKPDIVCGVTDNKNRFVTQLFRQLKACR